MPRLPFQLDHKAVAKAVDAKKKEQITIRTDQKPLPYDSTRTYMQLGTSLKASEHAQVSAMRVARMMSESKEAEELQEAALAERLRNLVLEIDDFEKTLIKFKRGKTMRMSSLATDALQNLKTATMWFTRFVASHNEEDREQFKAVMGRLEAVSKELLDLRKKKVDDTVAMEDAFNEKRASAYRKAASTQSVGRPPEIDKRRTYPEPAESPIKFMGDPASLIDAAKQEILEKEQDSQLEEQK